MTIRPAGSPPESIEIDGVCVDLRELALEICVRYRAEFEDELSTVPGLADDWCLHDNQWLLSWAFEDVLGHVDFEEQATWLARVLYHRSFPLERYLRNLTIASQIVGARFTGESRAAVVSCIERVAAIVAATNFEDSDPPSDLRPETNRVDTIH